LQQPAGQLEIAAKVQRSYQPGGHDFRVTHLALLVLIVMQRFQHVVTQTKDCYNLAVHVASWLRCGLVLSTLPEGAWTF
jgi:hypothetical protein